MCPGNCTLGIVKCVPRAEPGAMSLLQSWNIPEVELTVPSYGNWEPSEPMVPPTCQAWLHVVARKERVLGAPSGDELGVRSCKNVCKKLSVLWIVSAAICAAAAHSPATRTAPTAHGTSKKEIDDHRKHHVDLHFQSDWTEG